VISSFVTLASFVSLIKLRQCEIGGMSRFGSELFASQLVGCGPHVNAEVSPPPHVAYWCTRAVFSWSSGRHHASCLGGRKFKSWPSYELSCLRFFLVHSSKMGGGGHCSVVG
jgi:hypothetical protein